MVQLDSTSPPSEYGDVMVMSAWSQTACGSLNVNVFIFALEFFIVGLKGIELFWSWRTSKAPSAILKKS